MPTMQYSRVEINFNNLRCYLNSMIFKMFQFMTIEASILVGAVKRTSWTTLPAEPIVNVNLTSISICLCGLDTCWQSSTDSHLHISAMIIHCTQHLSPSCVSQTHWCVATLHAPHCCWIWFYNSGFQNCFA